MAKRSAKGRPRIPGGRSRWWLTLAILPTVAVLAFLAGIGPFQPREEETTLSALPAGSALRPAPDRPPAPDFSVTTTAGIPFRLADYRGKVVVLFFTGPG